MKLRLFFTLLSFTALFGAAQAQVSLDQIIKFESENHQFGDVKEGDAAEHTYAFTNVSDKPIKLTHVKPGCGCTASEYTKDVVPPGGKGFVKASYGTQGRPGTVTKYINVQASPTENLDDAGSVIDMEKTQNLRLEFSINVLPKPVETPAPTPAN